MEDIERKGFRPSRERCHVVRITSYNLHALLPDPHTYALYFDLLYPTIIGTWTGTDSGNWYCKRETAARVDVRYREISGRGVYRGVDLEANFFNFACTQSAGNQLVHPRSLLIAFAVCVYIYMNARLHGVSYLYLWKHTVGEFLISRTGFLLLTSSSRFADREKHGILPILTLRNPASSRLTTASRGSIYDKSSSSCPRNAETYLQWNNKVEHLSISILLF